MIVNVISKIKKGLAIPYRTIIPLTLAKPHAFEVKKIIPIEREMVYQLSVQMA